MNLNHNKTNKLQKTIESDWFNFLMLLCCFGFALFKLSYRDVGDVFQTILLMGSLLALYTKKDILSKNVFFILLVTATAIPIVSWLNSIIEIPLLADKSPTIGAISNFYFFIFIAYWLNGSNRNVLLFLSFFGLGVLLTLYSYSPNIIEDIQNGFMGQRVDFSYVNANHPAALLGCLAMISIFIIFDSFLVKQKYQVTSFFLVIFLISFCFLIFTQSRQSWLAFLVGTFIAIVTSISFNSKLQVKKMYFTFILILALLVFGIFQIDIVKERVETEWFIIPSILSGDIDKIPYTSMGARFHFWYESIDWIKNHPIAGLGHETRSLVISTSERLPDYIKAKFSHLHSGHIEMLVNYGILGYLNFLLLCYFVIKYSFSIKTPNYIKSITLGFMAFFFIINAFESFINFNAGLYLFICICSISCTFKFKTIFENR